MWKYKISLDLITTEWTTKTLFLHCHSSRWVYIRCDGSLVRNKNVSSSTDNYADCCLSNNIYFAIENFRIYFQIRCSKWKECIFLWHLIFVQCKYWPVKKRAIEDFLLNVLDFQLFKFSFRIEIFSFSINFGHFDLY